MNRITAFVIFMFVAVTLLAPRPCHADLYTYTDDDGVIHITNAPTSIKKYKWFMPEYGQPASALAAISSGHHYDDLINGASARWGVDPTLVKAVVKAESNFNPNAVSRAGAKGLMQLMPKTAILLGVKDVYDPKENISGGVRYLKKLLSSFNWDVSLAVAAYNAGEAAVRKYGTIPPYKETRQFVSRVLSYQKHYKGL